MSTKEPLFTRYIQNNHFGDYLGMNFQVISSGKVDYRLVITKNHLATPLSAHGGVIAALIDGALGVAALSVVSKDNKVVSTVEYKVNFLAPAFMGDQLCARAEVLTRGKRLLVVTCDVYCENKDNQIIAKAMGTFNAYPAEKAGY